MPGGITAAVLVTAAGLSTRFITSSQSRVTRKKEFCLIDGEYVLNRTIRAFREAFNSSGHILSRIIVTCTPGQGEETREIISLSPAAPPALQDKSLIVIDGGATRQESVYTGLKTIIDFPGTIPDIVLIHDGSRPWVSRSIILRSIEGALQYGGAAPVIKLVDSLKSIGSDGTITGHHNRELFAGVQTPQTFRFPDIYQAHESARERGLEALDDTEIFTAWGGTVTSFPGEMNNRKITYITDIPGSNNEEGSNENRNRN